MTALSCGVGHTWLVPMDADFRKERCPKCGLMDITEARKILKEAVEDSIWKIIRAPAVFAHWQDRPGKPPVAMFNLTADIPGHPAGSTVARETLERAGYEVPEPSTDMNADADPRVAWQVRSMGGEDASREGR